MALAELNVKIGTDLANLRKGLSNAEKSLSKWGDKISRQGMQITAGLTTIFGGVGAAAMSSAVRMERMSAGMTTVMGSADKARVEIEKLRQVAEMPGVDFAQAVEGSVKLQSVGLSADQSRESIAAFGNAMALTGGSSDQLDGVVTALSQISSKGKVSAEEIGQLAERVPQIRKVMLDAFGTADTEVLQKMGISSEVFIAKVTDSLEKLPKATLTIGDHFDNLKSATMISLGTIGSEVSKAFNLEAVVPKIGAAIAQVGAWFAGLNDKTKRLVFTLAGITAAIGPSMIAFGAIASVAARVSAGLGMMAGGAKTATSALTIMTGPVGKIIPQISKLEGVVGFLGRAVAFLISPVGLIIAGIVALTAAVFYAYKNWDALKTRLGGFLTILKLLVLPTILAWEAMKKLAEIAVYVATNWDNLGKELGVVGYVIKAVLAPIAVLVKAAKFLYDNWKDIPGFFSKVWQAILRDIENKMNAIIGVVNFGLRVLGMKELDKARLTADKVIDLPSFKSAGAVFSELGADIAGLAGFGTATKAKAAPVPTDGGGASVPTSIAAPAITTGQAGSSASGGGSAVDEAMVNNETTALQELDAALAMVDKRFQAYGNEVDVAAEKQSAFQGAIDRLMTEGVSPSDPQMQILIDRYKDLGNVVTPMPSAFDVITEKLTTQADAINTTAIPAMTALETKMSSLQNIQQGLNQVLGASGKAMQDYAAQGGKSFKELGKSALKAAADVVRAKLMEAVAAVFANSAALGPAGAIIAPIAAAAVGVAFNAALSSAKIPAFADGAVVYGPTLGLMGEYAGARSNPEIIAPLDKLQSIMGGGGGGNMNVSGSFRLMGDDLYASIERNDRSNRRSRSESGGRFG
jgi:tape measure domain-containing protein